MKYLIFSDLHGGKKEAELIVHLMEKEHCDQMICLGDVLYHGPRNDLPEGYHPKGVIPLLNQWNDKIICIQGNCDAEVDQMVLNFKLNTFLDITMNGFSVHLEHGHHLEEYHGKKDIIFYGHTHIPVIEKKENQWFVNPGSITLPKGGHPKSYIIMDESNLFLYSIDGKLLKECNLK